MASSLHQDSSCAHQLSLAGHPSSLESCPGDSLQSVKNMTEAYRAKKEEGSQKC